MEKKADNYIVFYVAVILISCLIIFVKDKNSKAVIQTTTKQQTIQKTP